MVNWLESLTHETRERVFVVMRKLREDSTRFHEASYKLAPRYGEISAGANQFDMFIKGEVIAVYLGELGRGKAPQNAWEHTLAFARDAVKIHNSRRVKDFNWQRSASTADSQIDDIHRRIVATVDESRPE